MGFYVFLCRRRGGHILRDLSFEASSQSDYAGIDEEKVFDTNKQYHVHCVGADGYSISVPLEVAIRIDRETTLVTRMNGHDIPRDHGY